ncbi:ribonuclease Z [Maribacter sp. 2-571]|uniref:ribonuclease Z n=1 Tax=Maribacter sp. 2-571 TaxID=3417569 RepID=UPI003D335066
MIFDKNGNTTVVSQENIAIPAFLENLNAAYPKLESDNIIVNLFSFSKLGTGDVLEFLDIARTHTANGKSFVLVTDKVGYEDVPDAITVVPTIQEAKDIIEMEEIERDLGI